jgi:hypothetical protein
LTIHGVGGSTVTLRDFDATSKCEVAPLVQAGSLDRSQKPDWMVDF